MRGILLAGGMGTRLHPTTQVVNKHLISIFDKPMIYYPLTTLILANVKDICIVSTTTGVKQFKELLGDGSQWGIRLSFAVQESANGIADGIQVALKAFDTDDSVLVILGDNIFYGLGLGRRISEVVSPGKSMVWIQEVENPESFGIATLGDDGQIESIIEKPIDNRGNLAITGLYYFPSDVKEIVNRVKASSRGEKEITDVLSHYLQNDSLLSENLSRGVFWLDAGTVENLLEASLFVRLVQTRQGLLIGSPDEAAWQVGNINKKELEQIVMAMPESRYRNSLSKIML